MRQPDDQDPTEHALHDCEAECSHLRTALTSAEAERDEAVLEKDWTANDLREAIATVATITAERDELKKHIVSYEVKITPPEN